MKGEFIARKLRHAKKAAGESASGGRATVTTGGGFTWTDLQNPGRQHMMELAKEYNLNMLNVEDCLTKFELPKLDVYPEHVFLILHFPPLKSTMMPRHSQLSIFMGKDFLITVHQGDLSPLVELVDACSNGADPERKDRALRGSTAVLLHEILDALVDDLLHTLRKIMANLEEIEEVVFDDRRSAARKISLLRREITMLRRIVGPLKRIVLDTAKQVNRSFATEDLTLYFDDVIDHIDKVVETLEESRETMEIYKDTDFMLSTEKTNKVLAILTIIFTLAIPATVLGTFYGMNINLPGGPEEPGTYAIFTTVILASLIPAAVMFAYFKRLGWLNN
ncbi:Mg2 and Co2 transporter [Cenarchaeum symbiosum A]|uniref:Mg2 and Co2 transporter n=1 Tax=Cenarchaeum symbiosum (strain A) TaxID=414004 RepID=A0RY34_CENSY|nr:Mg2 and Co2 transporter [Cenarchaeum symbiosum A]